MGRIKGISRKALQFHNTRLSRTVEHSYQALALDEYRFPYKAELWNNFLPNGVHPENQRAHDKRMIEQRWFAGAHCNVGGGYQNDLLPQRPLRWIQQKAKACGLGFRCEVHIPNDYTADLKMSARNSYSEFLLGTWKFLTLGQRYVRAVMAAPVLKPSKMRNGRETKEGFVYPANERIDYSVFQRCELNRYYCSHTLIAWLKRKQLDIQHILANPKRYEHLWAPVAGPGIEPPLGPIGAPVGPVP
jgi:hypothetical protein